jgi:hypothetical protein
LIPVVEQSFAVQTFLAEVAIACIASMEILTHRLSLRFFQQWIFTPAFGGALHG